MKENEYRCTVRYVEDGVKRSPVYRRCATSPAAAAAAAIEACFSQPGAVVEVEVEQVIRCGTFEVSTHLETRVAPVDAAAASAGE